MNNPEKFRILKNVLIGLAVINLVLLFVFHYELPSFLKHKLNEKKQAEATTEAVDESALNIAFPEDEFLYDGSEDLDLTEGVTITNKEGEEIDAELYSSFSAGVDEFEKIITYTAKDEEGNTAVAKRILLLDNYKGPSISIAEETPTINETQLGQILDIFTENEAVSALDGFGKDISSALKCSYSLTDETAREIEITFAVTNMFEESTTEKVTIPLERTKPLIALKQATVTVEVGSSFDPISYVHSATNEEAKDLRDIIELTGEVDTMTAGTYELTYSLTDSDMEQADPVTLTVVVE